MTQAPDDAYPILRPSLASGLIQVNPPATAGLIEINDTAVSGPMLVKTVRRIRLRKLQRIEAH
jgi:hypothetical protein